MEEKSEESRSQRLKLMVEVRTSKPKVSVEFSSSFCEGNEACIGDERESDSDDSCVVCVKLESSKKHIQCRRDKGTAAAQTQMPSTKPKARKLVACRQVIDVNEATSLRDQTPPSRLSFRGTVTSTSTDPKRTSPVHASITENKSQYYRELCLQVEDKKQHKERERSRNIVDEQKHNETMQNSIWGMPGNGAPNYHLGTMKRTTSLYSTGILPQEQIHDKSFSRTPFHRL